MKNTERRISAGAIIIRDDRILLVRYRSESGGSFLVGPGGGVEIGEGLDQAAIREVREETGLEVVPRKNRVLFVEDLAFDRYQLTKIWFLCDVTGGRLANTEGAKEEGIEQVRWYRRDQLDLEVVFPPPLMTEDWAAFSQRKWETIYLPMRHAEFE